MHKPKNPEVPKTTKSCARDSSVTHDFLSQNQRKYFEAHEQIKLYGFGLDYLRFNFAPDFMGEFFDSLMRGMSSNSNQKYQVSMWGRNFEAMFLENPSRRIFVLQFYGDSVIEVCKILDQGIVQSISWVVSFYSTYFQIPELSDILPAFIQRYGKDISVSRCDICLDTDLSIEELYKFKLTQFRKTHKIMNGKAIETFYLGAKSKNKKHFIRVYNKKLDSMKKGKYHLFLPYMQYDRVTRIEVQMNISSCKAYGITPELMYDFSISKSFYDARLSKSRLWQIFTSITRNPRGTCFIALLIIEDDNAEIIRPRKATTSTEILEEIPYAKIMLGYAQRLTNQGFDVFDFLQKNLTTISEDQKSQLKKKMSPRQIPMQKQLHTSIDTLLPEQ